MRLQPLNRFGRWGVFQQPVKPSICQLQIQCRKGGTGELVLIIEDRHGKSNRFLSTLILYKTFN